jgi:hypothetical protein
MRMMFHTILDVKTRQLILEIEDVVTGSHFGTTPPVETLGREVDDLALMNNTAAVFMVVLMVVGMVWFIVWVVVWRKWDKCVMMTTMVVIVMVLVIMMIVMVREGPPIPAPVGMAKVGKGPASSEVALGDGKVSQHLCSVLGGVLDWSVTHQFDINPLFLARGPPYAFEYLNDILMAVLASSRRRRRAAVMLPRSSSDSTSTVLVVFVIRAHFLVSVVTRSLGKVNNILSFQS